MSRWRPEADSGPEITVAAFGQDSAPPSIPAPLIRVRAGTVIDATVRNALTDSSLIVRGLHTYPSTKHDSTVIRPGSSTHFTFAAGAPGTYFYSADVGNEDTTIEREQLAGALIVDSAGATPKDRVFVMNIWGQALNDSTYRNALAINGRSFPFDERITAPLGDTVRWRWVNPTIRNHPMHLHGFYFRVDSRGDQFADTAYQPAAQRLVVTENMRTNTTMNVVWVPSRVGNWLFHCHIGFHVVPDTRLDPPTVQGHEHHSGDFREHMAGLVLAISVPAPPGWQPPEFRSPRRMRLLVQEGHRRARAKRSLGYVLQQGTAAPAPDSVNLPGPVLVLTRGEPTEITVVNHLKEATAVHWHGIELQSYWDGVVGWSGQNAAVAPPIQPGDSFPARLTLPRAGTFIYHTHLNDLEQLTSGMYGAIVVMEPGRRLDPATDHVLVAGWDGMADQVHLLVNGDSLSAGQPPMTGRVGEAHRFRLVNIGAANSAEFALRRDSTKVMWRPVAKDGAELPAAQQVERRARQTLHVGETAEFVFQPVVAGNYLVVVRHPGDLQAWHRPFIVRP